MIEIMVGLAIVSILLVAGAPSFATFMQNRKVRNATDAIYSGLNLAKAEAVRRNTAVQITLGEGSGWTVGCVVQPAVASDCPASIQSFSSAEGNLNQIAVAATAGGNALTTVAFNGYGRVPAASAANPVHFDISNTTGTCEKVGGNMRCLRVVVNAGGQIRTCDPNLPTSNLQAC
jgi:type IV fimbrial biogenesis protein FimT